MLFKFEPKTEVSVVPTKTAQYFNAPSIRVFDYCPVVFSSSPFFGSDLAVYTNSQPNITIGNSNISTDSSSLTSGSYFRPNKVSITNATVGYFVNISNNSTLKLGNSEEENSIGIVISKTDNAVLVGTGCEVDYDGYEYSFDCSTQSVNLVIISNFKGYFDYGYYGKTFVVICSDDDVSVAEFNLASSFLYCVSGSAVVDNSFYSPNLLYASIPAINTYSTLFFAGSELGKAKISSKTFQEFRKTLVSDFTVIESGTFDLNFDQTYQQDDLKYELFGTKFKLDSSGIYVFRNGNFEQISSTAVESLSNFYSDGSLIPVGKTSTSTVFVDSNLNVIQIPNVAKSCVVFKNVVVFAIASVVNGAQQNALCVVYDLNTQTNAVFGVDDTFSGPIYISADDVELFVVVKNLTINALQKTFVTSEYSIQTSTSLDGKLLPAVKVGDYLMIHDRLISTTSSVVNSIPNSQYDSTYYIGSAYLKTDAGILAFFLKTDAVADVYFENTLIKESVAFKMYNLGGW